MFVWQVGGWGVWEGCDSNWFKYDIHIICKFCTNKVTTLPFMNARMLWMSSPYSVNTSKLSAYFTF